MSDYIILRVLNPRYKSNFWDYFTNPEYYYGFMHELSPEILFRLNEICALENKKSTALRHRKNLLYRVWGYKYVISDTLPRTITFVTIGKPQKWSVRIAGAYLKLYQAHWFHTSLRLLYCPKPGGNPFLIANWLNSPISNYGLIQQASRNIVWPTNFYMYRNLNSNILMNNPKKLPEFVENNFVMTLSPVTKLGWIIGTFNPMLNQYKYAKESMQGQSDAFLYKPESFYSGLDQKNKRVTFFGRNQAVVIDDQSYKKILNEFLVALQEKHVCTTQMIIAIEQLSRSSLNREEHLEYWSQYYTIFPPTWRPPMRLENSFDLKYLSDEALQAYYDAGPLLQRFSERIDLLQKERARKLKEISNYTAEDIFQDSQIQQMLQQ